MKEPELLNLIRLRLSQDGLRLFRNNVSTAWVGKIIERSHDYVLLAHPHVIAAGLGPGTSDLVGWAPRIITREMLGTSLAQFIAIEGKTGRQRETKEQAAFRQAVIGAGGLATVSHSVEEAVEAMLR